MTKYRVIVNGQEPQILEAEHAFIAVAVVELGRLRGDEPQLVRSLSVVVEADAPEFRNKWIPTDGCACEQCNTARASASPEGRANAIRELADYLRGVQEHDPLLPQDVEDIRRLCRAVLHEAGADPAAPAEPQDALRIAAQRVLAASLDVVAVEFYTAAGTLIRRVERDGLPQNTMPNPSAPKS